MVLTKYTSTVIASARKKHMLHNYNYSMRMCTTIDFLNLNLNPNPNLNLNHWQLVNFQQNRNIIMQTSNATVKS